MLPPFPETPPEGVVLQDASKGEDCNAACARLDTQEPALRWQCAPQHATLVNNCNVMRQRFVCQAGCEMSEGRDQPSYVLSEAPKTHRPTTCFIHEPALLGGFLCNGSHSQTQRLCPCLKTSP